MKKINWAIWGTGNICNKYAQAVSITNSGRLASVCSRTLEKAESFAKKYDIPKYYDDPAQMLADDEIDAVYLGSPNGAHLENVLACAAAGKNILCEKPAAVNEQEFNKMADAVKKAGVFFMEGIWTHFFPAILKARDWLASGEIGRPLRSYSNHSFLFDTGNWRTGRKEKGGAMLDLGIYCLTLVSFVFGLEPSAIKSVSNVRDGVDIADTVILQFDDDQIATFTCGFDIMGDHTAYIQGEDGAIIIYNDFGRPSKAELFKYDKTTLKIYNSAEVFEMPYESTGFQYEADHVAECILAGKKESDVIPVSKSLQLIKIIDGCMKEWGVNY